jgi:hypothetical protein
MTRPETRAEKIAAIHKERESHVLVAEALGKHLAGVGAQLAEIERIRADLAERVEDEAHDLLRSWSVPLRVLSDHVVRERAALDRALTRLSRPALNVGMVGRARQGKSKFLQSLTGLKSNVIPDGAAGFCTGVPSIVQHVPGGGTYADVYFHSPESFLAEVVTPYYERLSLGAPPTSPEGFSRAALPALPPDSSATDKGTHAHLGDYHRAYPEYRSLIGAMSPRRVGPDEIRGFVAQDDESGQRLNSFRAVRRVNIATAFPKTDLSGVSVIDLPGLGDTNLGDSRVMLSALEDDVDLVLFLRRPNPEGDGVHDYDVNLYDIARDSLAEIPMERRSFLILNHRRSEDPAQNNLARCEEFQRLVESGSSIRVAEVIIADCSSEDEVAAAFDRVVDYLLSNIADLDRLLLDERTRRVAEIDEQVRLLVAQLDSLRALAPSKEADYPVFEDLFSETYENLSAEIELLVSRYEAERKVEDSHLQKAVADALERARADDSILSASKIERQKAVYGTYAAAYSHLLDETRAHLSRQFLDLDVALKDAVEEMWNRVAQVLIDAGRLGQISDRAGKELLITFAERIPPIVRRDGPSEVRFAVEILIEFELSYRSFIQHRIRDCLDGMQADHPRIKILPDTSPPPDGVFVREALSETYQETLFECEQRLRDLLTEPNKALHGIVEEFRDRVLRSRRIQNEWRAIYQDMRTEIWADQFAALAESAVHMRTWNEAVQQLRNLLNDGAVKQNGAGAAPRGSLSTHAANANMEDVN